MVDVSGKDVTAREASAAGRVLLSPRRSPPCGPATCRRVTRSRWRASPASRRAKRTPSWSRSRHPIAVHAVTVDLTVADDGVDIAATVRTADRTGIEMEALTAVCVGALALVDMVKAVDKHARITDVRVTAKSGGRSGDWTES